ncbi:MAG TPA: aminotransferase class IV [Bacteroidia bacterium]|nr:aminotransferase class IV [Bacteroidia bacterium]
MYQLIETIKVVNRQFQNLGFHNNRLNRSRRELFGSKNEIDIKEIVSLTSLITEGVYKCTITYSAEIADVQFQPYIIRKIETLKIITDNKIKYSYKYADRTELNEILERKGGCDEIIIVKDNMITDTSFSNLIFFDGLTWHTPVSPLLKGTKREKLVSLGLIKEAKIGINDLVKYNKVGLINAMLEMGDIVIDVANVK